MKTKLAILILFIAGAAMAQRGNPGGGNSGGRQAPSPADFVSRLDTDGDGMVSETEFDGPADHFATSDANGDGYLSEDEAPSGPPPRR